MYREAFLIFINYLDILFCEVSAQVFFKRFYFYIFRERGKEGEREGQKHQCVVASRAPPNGDLAHNPGTCPDWEWNWWSFGQRSVHCRTQVFFHFAISLLVVVYFFNISLFVECILGSIEWISVYPKVVMMFCHVIFWKLHYFSFHHFIFNSSGIGVRWGEGSCFL